METPTDGDYETSSEGAIRDVQGKQIIKEIPPRNPRRMGSVSEFDAEKSELKGGKSSKELSRDEEAVFSSTALSKSEPLLKSVNSSKEKDDEEDIALTSESSIARRRKMKMIVARIGPLLSSGSNLSSSANTSETDVVGGNYEPKKLESKTALPVLQVITRESAIDSLFPSLHSFISYQRFSRFQYLYYSLKRSKKQYFIAS